VGRHGLSAALAASLFLLATGCDGNAPPRETSTATDTAVDGRINDGDTLTLRDGAKVRLVQIDAPELTTDCYGAAARRTLAALVPVGTRVRLVRDPALDATDRYGRLLRYVLVGDTDVNIELVRRGAASPYFFRNERGEHARELLDAVDEARAARAGYWGACPAARLNTGLGSLTGTR
jgi:micrococcal nuclease